MKIQHFLSLPQTQLVFVATGNGDLSSQYWNPGLCLLAWTGIPHSPDIPPNFYPQYMNVGPAVPLPLLLLHATPPLLLSQWLCPSYPPGWMWLLKSLVVGLPYSSIFWRFWVFFVLRSSCNSFYGYARKWRTSIHTSILTGSFFHIAAFSFEVTDTSLNHGAAFMVQCILLSNLPFFSPWREYFSVNFLFSNLYVRNQTCNSLW